MTDADAEFEIDDSGEALLVEWLAPYVALRHDLAALQNVNTSVQSDTADAISRLERIASTFDDCVSWSADRADFTRIHGMAPEDAESILSLFRNALARLKRVEGLDLYAAETTMGACRGLAACMAELIGMVYS